MFVQIMTGTVADPDLLRRQMDAWVRDLAAGAEGWLGVTAGLSRQGPYVTAVRFESEEAARANSERPEQGEWWKETEAAYDGPVTFVDSNDVDLFLGGGSDDAAFVQIMQARVSDRKRFEAIEEQLESTVPLSEVRPEIIGGVTAWEPDGRMTAVNYFTSEEQAREGEAKEPPAEVAELLQEWQGLMSDVEWFDIPDPDLRSS